MCPVALVCGMCVCTLCGCVRVCVKPKNVHTYQSNVFAKTMHIPLTHPLYMSPEMFAISIESYGVCYSPRFYSHNFPWGLQRIFWNVIEINCHAHCLAWWKPRKSQPQHDCSALKSQLTFSTAQSSLLTVFSAYRCVLRNSSYIHDWLAQPTLLLVVIKFWCW